MRPLRTRLQEARRRTGLPWQVIERDYLLSWILASVSHVPVLGDSLVFKGGTALKKCYFGDYRFSEDLDFTGLTGTPSSTNMERCVGQMCEVATRLVEEYAPVEITYRRYTEREPHPGGQEAFEIYATYPWQAQPYTKVKIEVTMDEPIFRPVENRTIIHDYEELLEAEVKVYSLEEIVAEKLRAVLQQTEALRARGWVRSRARDYYDIWRILDRFRDRMDLANFSSLLNAKCAVRNVQYDSYEDFFREDMLIYVEATWRDYLEHLVPRLPPFELVINELSPQVLEILDL